MPPSSATPPPASPPAPAARARLHPDVLRLGLVSFLTDLSSEMIFSVFAVFFTSVAGASAALLGLIEGLADFSASALNYLAGWLSDRSGARKRLALAGYGFSTLAKLILLLSSSLTGLSLFRVIERLGKGFRGPPRDAWLSAIAQRASRGYAFGVHKALDKAGAVLGPLAAYALLTGLGESPASYRLLFWLAFLPALLAVLLLALLREQPGTPHPRENPSQNWRALSPAFKRFLLPSGLFALGYFSLGFLLLRAHQLGFGLAQTVLLYALFNTSCVASAPLLGRLGDRLGRARVLMLGYGLYLLVNAGLLLAEARWQIVGLFALYGVFYAIDESQSKAFIADLEPERRATAVGAYNFVCGAAYVAASLAAGALWSLEPRLAFAWAVGFSLAALLAFRLRPPVCDGAASAARP